MQCEVFDMRADHPCHLFAVTFFVISPITCLLFITSLPTTNLSACFLCHLPVISAVTFLPAITLLFPSYLSPVTCHFSNCQFPDGDTASHRDLAWAALGKNCLPWRLMALSAPHSPFSEQLCVYGNPANSISCCFILID